MSRFPFLLVSLAATACTGDAAAPISSDPVRQQATAIDPGPRTRPIVEDPTACMTIDLGTASFATTGHDELRDVIVTPRGTVLAAGYENGTATPHGMFGSRGTVLEYWPDLTGVDRRANLDTLATDSFEAIVAAPDTGKVWLAARTNGELPNLQSRGGFDFVVGELATPGGFQPLARGIESTPEYPRRLAIGADGLLAVAGDEQRTMPDNTTSFDPFLAVYDTEDGSALPVWFTSRRHAANESYRALDVSAGAVIVGGAIQDGDEQGMFIAAHDVDAGLLWRRQLSQLGMDTVSAVKILPGGDVLWAGTSASQLGDVSHGGLDLVVGKLAGTTGDPLWTVQYGTEGDDRARDLSLDDSGRIHVVGEVAAYTAEGPRGDVDAYLLVLDADGSERMQEHWTSDGDDRATAVTVDACGGIAIVGYTTGDLVGVPQGGRDGFVLVTRLAQ